MQAVGAAFLAAVTLLGQLGEPVKSITPAEARKFIGTNAVVVGKVAPCLPEKRRCSLAVPGWLIYLNP